MGKTELCQSTIPPYSFLDLFSSHPVNSRSAFMDLNLAHLDEFTSQVHSQDCDATYFRGKIWPQVVLWLGELIDDDEKDDEVRQFQVEVWDTLVPMFRAQALRRAEMKYPVAKTIPHVWTPPQSEPIIDEYWHLRDISGPETQKLINSEIGYADGVIRDLQSSIDILSEEMQGRKQIAGNEQTPSTRIGDYSYFMRKTEDQDYAVHVRVNHKKHTESIIADPNEIGSNVSTILPSPDGNLLCYCVDRTGEEYLDLVVVDLRTGEALLDSITDCYYGVAWGSDSATLYYTKLNQTGRSASLYRHIINNKIHPNGERDGEKIDIDMENGTEDYESEADVCLYEENDERMWLFVHRSECGSAVLVNSAAVNTSMMLVVQEEAGHHIVSGVDVDGGESMESISLARPLIPKVEGVEYEAIPLTPYNPESSVNKWIVLSNEDGNANKFVYATEIDLDADGNARENEKIILIESRPFVYIDSIQTKKSFLIAFERTNCVQGVRICHLDLETVSVTDYHYISFSDVVFGVHPGEIHDWDSDGIVYGPSDYTSHTIRMSFSSLVKPRAVIEYDMVTRTSQVLSEEHVAGYDPDEYCQSRCFALSDDGTAVPLSMVYRKDKFTDGKPMPCLITGYGAYGSPIYPVFSSFRLSLLDRGFLFVQAHVRGGSDMGSGWITGGRGLKKPNSILDMVAACKFLINEKYSSPDLLCLHGRSAGGLLAGATLNKIPDLLQAVILEVPFVDVLSTVCDSTQTWTSFETEEWGDPNSEDVVSVIKSYCPYQNIAKCDYPSVFINCGLNDPRVSIHEPLKYASRLRAKKTDDNPVVVSIQDSGHLKTSYSSEIEKVATGFAWLLNQVGLLESVGMNGGDSSHDHKLLGPIEMKNKGRTGFTRQSNRIFSWIHGPLQNLKDSVSPDWWKTLFKDEIYLLTDGDVVEDPSLTTEEVDVIEEWTDVSKDEGTILDVCCGQGRHSIELAKRGYKNVTGVDYSQYLIDLATNRAKKDDLPVKFVQSDARKLPIKSFSVDLVICMGNSFGYFATADDDSMVLQEIRRVLKPSGNLFLDIADGTYLLQNYAKRSWEWINSDYFVCRERELDGTRLISREVVCSAKDGIIRDQLYAERLYSQDAIVSLLHQNLLHEVYSLERYWTESKRDEDLGMMENRQMLVAAAAPIQKLLEKLNLAPKKQISPTLASVRGDQAIQDQIVDILCLEIVKGKEVYVILPDPNLADSVKPGGTFSEEDAATVSKLKDALKEMSDEYYFNYLADHTSLVDDLQQLAHQPILVLNFCDTGYKNNPMLELNIPSLCDLFSLKYSGSGARTLAACYDKAAVLALADSLHVPIPKGYETTIEELETRQLQLPFPVILKPNMADGGFGITARSVCYDNDGLSQAIEGLKDFKYSATATILAEEYLEGADLTVGVMEVPGDGEDTKLRFFPITEDDYSILPDGLPHIAGYESKWLPNTPYWNVKAKVAKLTPEAEQIVVDGSAKLFRRLDLHDYARFDWRVGSDGIPRMLEVNPNPGWCWDGHLAKGAAFDGVSYPEMLRMLIDSAISRNNLWVDEVAAVPPPVELIVQEMNDLVET